MKRTSAAHKTSDSSVQSVERAFQILEILAEVDNPLSLALIVEKTGLARTTVHRLLKTLQSLGHVQQMETRDYSLGSGLMRLGNRATPALVTRATPVMVELEEQIQETVNLSILTTPTWHTSGRFLQGIT